MALYQDSRAEHFLPEVEALLQQWPETVLAWMLKGASLLSLKQHDVAIEAFIQAVKLDPKNRDTHTNLALAYKKSGQPERATQAYLQGLHHCPDDPGLRLNLAQSQLKQGAFAEAEASFKQLLTKQAPQAAILNGLGTALERQGKPCLESFQQAVALDASYLPAWSNLAIIYTKQSRISDAIAAWHEVIKRSPEDANPLEQLANLLLQEQRHGEAEPLFHQALKRNAQTAGCHLGLGIIALAREEDATPWFKRTIELAPELPHGFNNMAIALAKLLRYAEAKPYFERAIELDPAYTDALANYANCLTKLRDTETAIAVGYRALKQDRQNFLSYRNLGHALIYGGRFSEAEAIYQQGLGQFPGDPILRLGLGNALKSQFKWDAAIACHEALLKDYPENADNSFNLAILYLTLGHYSRAWPLYESRWKMGRTSKRKIASEATEWQGELLRDQTLLVYSEQGQGDLIQFVRYLPQLKARYGCSVILQIPESLYDLCRELPHVEQVITGKAPLPAFDRHVALMSLPARLGLTADEPTSPCPYLHAAESRVSWWRQRLGPSTAKLRVGLVWAGNFHYINDHKRSLPFALLAPLWELPEIDFYSLQVGEKGPNYGLVQGLTELEPELTSFAETAAAMENLDLIISVDTAVAHLAGALRRPVWLLLSEMPDWRWGLEGQTTHWYPTMRIFRQMPGAGWQATIEEIKKALIQRLSL
uniref:Uncharacterized protein n=1 Tax=Magnetococcus massalia (strain MO-1) TaxID=451514 RepID=A0A1S7LLB4_MAGMO|nr:conserved protein of unknown function [Include 9 copies of TPR repeat] [Candidatus Magnetococcus massalia]